VVGPGTRSVGPTCEASGRRGGGEAIDCGASIWRSTMVGRQGGEAGRLLSGGRRGRRGRPLGASTMSGADREARPTRGEAVARRRGGGEAGEGVVPGYRGWRPAGRWDRQARLAADGAVVRPSIVGPTAGGRRWWGSREARPAAYSQAAEEGGGSEASRCEAGGGEAGAAVGEGVRRRGWRPAGWGGGAGDESSRAGRRGGGRDEGDGRPACGGAADGGGAGARPWAGDEAGGGAGNWQPAVVGRQGGEADRLGRGWRGGGGRRVRVVRPRTRPVGPARRHRQGGRAGRGKGVGGSAEGEAGPTRGVAVMVGWWWGWPSVAAGVGSSVSLWPIGRPIVGRPWCGGGPAVGVGGLGEGPAVEALVVVAVARGGGDCPWRGGRGGVGHGGSSPWRVAVVAGVIHGGWSGRSCRGGRPESVGYGGVAVGVAVRGGGGGVVRVVVADRGPTVGRPWYGGGLAVGVGSLGGRP
nr:hypothetical protein [Tanacetum cinerariifolium]